MGTRKTYFSINFSIEIEGVYGAVCKYIVIIINANGTREIRLFIIRVIFSRIITRVVYDDKLFKINIMSLTKLYRNVFF